MLPKVLTELLFGPPSPIYQRWLLVGDDPHRAPWAPHVWALLVPRLEAIATGIAAPLSLSVRVLDSSRQGPVTSRNPKVADLSWCNAISDLSAVRFAEVEVVCPGFGQARRRKRWPAFYLQATRPFHAHQSFAIHIAVDSSASCLGSIHSLLPHLVGVTASAFVASTESQWHGLPQSGTLNHFLSVGFHYRGGHADALPDLSKVEGRWHLDPPYA